MEELLRGIKGGLTIQINTNFHEKVVCHNANFVTYKAKKFVNNETIGYICFGHDHGRVPIRQRWPTQGL